MKTIQKLKVLITLVALMSVATTHAQVKIGQDTEPVKGTALELNSNTGGYIGSLRLTNVSLATITDLTPFSEKPVNLADLKGAIVYNTNAALKNDAGVTTGIGVYYWDGAKWIKEISASDTVTADNGLTRSTSGTKPIQLGGTLIKNTTIETDLNQLIFDYSKSIYTYPIIFNANKNTSLKDSAVVFSKGYVGIGNSNPVYKLDIKTVGTTPGFKLVDGTQGNGKVLTSDGLGVATWKDPVNDIATADNGLTRLTTGTKPIQLGGTLIQNTTVRTNSLDNTNQYSFTLNSNGLSANSFVFREGRVVLGTTSTSPNYRLSVYDGLSVGSGETFVNDRLKIGVNIENYFLNILNYKLNVGGSVSVHDTLIVRARSNPYKCIFDVGYTSADKSHFTGLVGIDVDPKYPLHTWGSAALAQSTGSQQNVWIGHSGQRHPGSTYNEGGRLGIGVDPGTIPAAKLHIKEGHMVLEGDYYAPLMRIVSRVAQPSPPTNILGGVLFGRDYEMAPEPHASGYGSQIAAFAGIYGIEEKNTDGTFRGQLQFRTTPNQASKIDIISMKIDGFGNVGVGAGFNDNYTNPTHILHIKTNGTKTIPVAGFRLEDGTQTDKYVLTSDKDGVGTWQPAGAVVEPWNRMRTTTPSINNNDSSYIMARVAIGADRPAFIRHTDYYDYSKNSDLAQFSVVGGDASINGVDVGRGRDNVHSNTAMGAGALARIDSPNGEFGVGDRNTAFGSRAGWRLTTGNTNTLLGAGAGAFITTGSNNIAIGFNAGESTIKNEEDDQLAIGHFIFGTNGDNSNNAKVGIGTSIPLQKLHVAGSTYTTENAWIDGRIGIKVPQGTRPRGALHIITEVSDYNYEENEKQNDIEIETFRAAEMDARFGSPSLQFRASRGTFEENSAALNGDLIGMICFRTNRIEGNAAAFIEATCLGNDKAKLIVKAEQLLTDKAWEIDSDRRLKTNITPLKYGLSEVMKLNPVNYEMKNNSGVSRVGFIAQEVKPIIPEVVGGTEGDLDKGETLSIAYSDFAPILTKAIQEQQQMIEAQQVQIELLLKINEQLEARLKALEAAK
ncbi:MAG: tail fiber domain-containing protein [Dysgonamonadaceae bacterium]|nr:tail fiber domain-containing protein [Dysgonamonadaceae bacterium]